ncbi:kinase-like protein [Acephala macrosclerotiorum]|nr:kinase-like protein [Acephala macrosclerotiorum]
MACILGTGSLGIVSVYEPDTRFILKGYEVWHNGRCEMRFQPTEDSRAALAVEDTVYQRLGFHPHILKYDGQALVAKDTFSIKLERAAGDLRGLILKRTAPAEQTRLKMAVQISCGMAHIHSKNVFHCDLSCRNVFVFEDWLVKIGDFGGSKIDNQEPLGAEEVRYELPLRGRAWQARDYRKRELFALGCAIYEIMAWKIPFAEMTEDQTEKNYANEVFPDTDGLLVGDIIRACWNEEFETAKDVEKALRKKLVDSRDMASPPSRSLLEALQSWVYGFWSAW